MECQAKASQRKHVTAGSAIGLSPAWETGRVLYPCKSPRSYPAGFPDREPASKYALPLPRRLPGLEGRSAL